MAEGRFEPCVDERKGRSADPRRAHSRRLEHKGLSSQTVSVKNTKSLKLGVSFFFENGEAMDAEAEATIFERLASLSAKQSALLISHLLLKWRNANLHCSLFGFAFDASWACQGGGYGIELCFSRLSQGIWIIAV